MSDKSCPFCGKEGCYVNYEGYEIDSPSSHASCHSEKCMPLKAIIKTDVWKNRPIEDALNARIAELEEENARLKAELYKYRWIPVSETDLIVSNTVLWVASEDGNVCEGYYLKETKKWYHNSVNTKVIKNPTHFSDIVIPEPPKA